MSTVSQLFTLHSPISGKMRPAIVVEPYEGTDIALVALIEPMATPFGIMFIEAKVLELIESAPELKLDRLALNDPLPSVPFGDPLENLTKNSEVE